MTAGWQTKKLKDVCVLINGRAYSKPELLPEGKYPVLRVGNFFTSTHWYYSDMELGPDKYCDSGDLLYAWSASFGPRIWDGGKSIFHYHIWKVCPIDEFADKRFLFYWFEWDAELIKKEQGAGTTMTHVSKGSMEERKISIPSISEQKRIVAILDEAFEGIATAKAHADRNHQNARDVFEGYLQSVFSKQGDGWRRTDLGSITIISSGSGFPLKHQGGVDAGIPFYKVSDMNLPGNERVMVFENNSITEEVRGVLGATLIPAGSVIFPKVGGAISTNKKRLTSRPCCVDNNVMAVTPRGAAITSEYLYYFFRSRNLSDFANDSHLPSIKKSTLDAWMLSVPMSIAEQDSIVRELDELSSEIDRLESLYERKISALDDLKKSLLHHAFSGQF